MSTLSMRSFYTILSTVFIFILFAGLPASATSPPQTTGSPIVLTVKDRRITLKADNVSYREILKKITEKTGIKTQVLDGVADKKVSVDVKDIPYLGISTLLDKMGIANYGIAHDRKSGELYVYVVNAGTNIAEITKGKTLVQRADFGTQRDITKVKGKEIITKIDDKKGYSVSYIKDELLVKFHLGTTAKEITETLAKCKLTASPDITLAKFGYTKVIIPDGRAVPDVATALAKERIVISPEPNYIQKILAISDPLYQDQWYAASSRFESAWPTLKSSTLVTVAVIDTGVQTDHPDLSGKVLKGYNFVTDKVDANDDNGHGTFVTGIIAANANNIGIKGMYVNARILPVKVMDANGVGTYEDTAKGIIYAADNGAKVINLSIGAYAYSPMLLDAVNYAQTKGCIIIAAGGNDGIEKEVYPAAYPDIIGVASLATDDSIWPSSNSGRHIAVTAPGANIISTSANGSYSVSSGTSAAAPMVTALAAILSAERPDLSASVIARLIQQTARDLGEKGKDKVFGAGAIDAVAALGQEVRAFHDVAVQRVFLDSKMIQEGKEAYVNVVIANLGSYATENASLKLLLNDAPIFEQQNIQLANNATFTLPIKLDAKQVASYKITATVTAELDDYPDNNSKSITNKFMFDEKQKMFVLLKDRPFVHSWVAWQAYQMSSSDIKADIQPYFWGGADPYLLFSEDKIWENQYCNPKPVVGDTVLCPTEVSRWGDDLTRGSSLIEGTWEEDQPSARGLWHFWDPDYSFIDGMAEHNSAPMVASQWWKTALRYYKLGFISDAYYLLGRVTHLLSDMGVPDHVHLDPHIDGAAYLTPNDFSNYEEYTKLYYRNYTQDPTARVSAKSLPLTQPTDADWFLAFPYNDDISGNYDFYLIKLFYNLAQYTQHFDSSSYGLTNPNGNSTEYSYTGSNKLTPINPPLTLKNGSPLVPQNGSAIHSYAAIAYPTSCGQSGIDAYNTQCGMDPGKPVTIDVTLCSAFSDENCNYISTLNPDVDYGLARGSGYIGLTDKACDDYQGMCTNDKSSTYSYSRYKMKINYTYRGHQISSNKYLLDYGQTSYFKTVPDSEIEKQANILMPKTISYVAALYELFWNETHDLTVSINPPSTTSPEAGPITVTITANQTATIYYTLDGSVPGTASKVLGASGEISIDKTTVVKCLAVNSFNKRSSIASATYQVDSHIGSPFSTTPYLEIQSTSDVRAFSLSATGLKLTPTDIVRLYPRNIAGWPDFKTLTGVVSVWLTDLYDKVYQVTGTLLPDGGVEFKITGAMPTTGNAYYKVLAISSLDGTTKHLAPGFAAQQLVEFDANTIGGTGGGIGGSITPPTAVSITPPTTVNIHVPVSLGTFSDTISMGMSQIYPLNISQDGKLEIKITYDRSLGGPYDPYGAYITLYRADGTTSVTGSRLDGSNTSRTLTAANLGPGTYYVAVSVPTGSGYPYGNNYSGAYSIEGTFTPALQISASTETEPNETPATANLLERQNTGSVGYVNDAGVTDRADYYKYVVSQDGKLEIKITYDRSLGGPYDPYGAYITVYRADGTTSVTGSRLDGSNTSRALTAANLGPGTYYVAVSVPTGSGYPYGNNYSGAYSIDGTFTPALQISASTETEPNDTPATANLLERQNTGSVGYVKDAGVTDRADYYKYVVSQDGKLEIKITYDRSLGGPYDPYGAYITLYRADGTTSVTGSRLDGSNTSRTLTAANLGPGTYYVAVSVPTGSGYPYGNNYSGAYSIEGTFTPTAPSTTFLSENLPDGSYQVGSATKTWRFKSGANAITGLKAKQVSGITTSGLGINQTEITIGNVAANTEFLVNLTINPAHDIANSKLSYWTFMDASGTAVTITNSKTGQFWLKVATNRSPAFSQMQLDSVAGQVNSSVSLPIQAADPDGDYMTYSVLTGGGSIVSGTWQGKPAMLYQHTFSAAGVYPVTLQIDDGHGDTASRVIFAVIAPDGRTANFYTDMIYPGTSSGTAYDQYAAIHYLTLNGITIGSPDPNDVTSRVFEPNNVAKQAEALAMVMKAATLRTGLLLDAEPRWLPNLVITDVANEIFENFTWAAPYLLKAEALGLIPSADTFNPSAPATRAWLATIVSRLMKLNPPVDLIDPAAYLFADASNFSTSADYDAARAVAFFGYMGQLGSSALFNPADSMIRADVAIVTSKILRTPSADGIITTGLVEQTLFGKPLPSITHGQNFTISGVNNLQARRMITSGADVYEDWISNAADYTTATIIRPGTTNPILGTTLVKDLAGTPVTVPTNPPDISFSEERNLLVLLESNDANGNNPVRAVIRLDYGVLFPDADGDGIRDSADLWPNNSLFSTDANGNGIPDNADALWGLAGRTGNEIVIINGQSSTLADAVANNILAGDKTAPTTSATPVAGSYTTAQTVTLTASETATIRCTTDGSTPTTASPLCSTTIPVSSSMTINYFAVDLVGNQEAVKQAIYTISSLPAVPGDCDNNGSVTIAEVQSAINMFLGLKTAESCVNIDGVGGVTIAEVQKVINSFLGL